MVAQSESLLGKRFSSCCLLGKYVSPDSTVASRLVSKLQFAIRIGSKKSFFSRKQNVSYQTAFGVNLKWLSELPTGRRIPSTLGNHFDHIRLSPASNRLFVGCSQPERIHSVNGFLVINKLYLKIIISALKFFPVLFGLLQILQCRIDSVDCGLRSSIALLFISFFLYSSLSTLQISQRGAFLGAAVHPPDSLDQNFRFNQKPPALRHRLLSKTILLSLSFESLHPAWLCQVKHLRHCFRITALCILNQLACRCSIRTTRNQVT